MKGPLLDRYRASLLATDLVERPLEEDRTGPSGHPLWRRYVASLLDVPLPRTAPSDGRSAAADSRRSAARVPETELAPVVVRAPRLVPGAALRPRRTGMRALVAAAALGAAAVAAVLTLPYASTSPTPPSATVSPSDSAAPDTPAGYRRVHDAEGFTLDVPRGWRRTQKTGSVFYRSPGGRSFIQIYRDTGPRETPYESLKTTAENVSANAGYRRVRLEKLGSGATAPAELEYTYDSPDLGPRRVLDRALTGDDGVRYFILLADPTDQRPEQRQRQDIVLRSFSVTG
ncbi:hypothetical protein [Streptomyces catenulae]|uniref:Serine/arginine repetitive matrix protein 2 n=1 Tax=Streptomyces catenulae TaxID=66875 RepID=A0ABV2YRZ3_9ACTN|nr:hypothetical protein [Streptomyces catenulae]